MWPFRSGQDAGERGERLARRYLRRMGCRILAANYRCPCGEADIIALDPSTLPALGAETLAFVEVKTRGPNSVVCPEAAVDAAKRRQIIRVAHYYLACHTQGQYPVRYDVVAVVLRPGLKPEIRHLPGAFVE